MQNPPEIALLACLLPLKASQSFASFSCLFTSCHVMSCHFHAVRYSRVSSVSYLMSHVCLSYLMRSWLHVRISYTDKRLTQLTVTELPYRSPNSQSLLFPSHHRQSSFGFQSSISVCQNLYLVISLLRFNPFRFPSSPLPSTLPYRGCRFRRRREVRLELGMGMFLVGGSLPRGRIRGSFSSKCHWIQKRIRI